MLKKSDIFGAKTRRKKIEAFGGDILIKSLSVGELQKIQNSDEKQNEAVLFLLYGVVDDTGAAMFDVSDYDSLEGLEASEVGKVYKEIIELSSGVKPEKEAEEEVEKK